MNQRINIAAFFLFVLVNPGPEAIAELRAFGAVGAGTPIPSTHFDMPTQPSVTYLYLNLQEDTDSPGTLQVGLTLDVHAMFAGQLTLFHTFAVYGTATRSGETITANLEKPAPGRCSVALALTKQGNTPTWNGTISFDGYGTTDHAGDGSGYLVQWVQGSGPITMTQFENLQFSYWENVIADWKTKNLPFAAAIRVLEKEYVSGAAKYRVLYREFPPVFDKVYKLKRDPTGKRGIIVRRGSGRAALIDLNDAFLSFTNVYSKVALGGKVLKDLSKSTLQTKTLVKLGLTYYDLPKDKLTAAAFLSKLAIRRGSAYRPLKDLYRDKSNYSYTRKRAINGMVLMKTNLLRIRELGIKSRNGIRSEGEALAADIEADTLLTAEEKVSLKFGLGIVIAELTN